MVSVSTSKLIYSSLIFLDNKLTLIWLLLLLWLSDSSVHNTQVILLIWPVLHLWWLNATCDTVSHFACNFAKCSLILKILLPANWVINLLWSNQSQLICLAMLPCGLLLITIHISDCRQFSGNMNLLQFAFSAVCLQCFDAVGWVARRASGL